MIKTMTVTGESSEDGLRTSFKLDINGFDTRDLVCITSTILNIVSDSAVKANMKEFADLVMDTKEPIDLLIMYMDAIIAKRIKNALDDKK